MSDIAPILGLNTERPEAIGDFADRHSDRTPSPGRAGPERPSDRVDISDRARFLNKLASLPDIRQDVVDRLRDQVAAGDYDTPDKLDQALSSLLDEFDAGI